jgi:uncharacterized protein YdhG (YjbR/CyaY superfamily)
MSQDEIDDYLAELGEASRETLEALRSTILAVIPDAEQGMAYGVPAFKVNDKAVAGFAGFKNHLSYFPHSGSVLQELEADLADYSTSKGTLRFPIDEPLPAELVEKLIAVRLRHIAARHDS